MNVALLVSLVPFAQGEEARLAVALRAQLTSRGHRALLVRMPFSPVNHKDLLDAITAARLLRVERVDRVIGLSFPAYHVRHTNKVIWLLSQFQPAYEWWGTPGQNLSFHPNGLVLRQAVLDADGRLLREARAVYANSQATGKRLGQFLHMECPMLIPPLPDAQEFGPGESENHVVCTVGSHGLDRLRLAIASLRQTKAPLRMHIVGPLSSPEIPQILRELARQEGLAERVSIADGGLSIAEHARLMTASLACLHIPFLSDSIGLATLEAFSCAKPVITCTDSGAPLEAVQAEATGLVVPPHPDQIAGALDRLHADRALARRIGFSGLEWLRATGLNWDAVVEPLLA